MVERHIDIVSKLLSMSPRITVALQEVSGVMFDEEIARFSEIIQHMFEDTQKTDIALNRIIVYTEFNCIFKTLDTRKAFFLLFKKGLLPQAFSLNRMLFEQWASACFVERTVRDFVGSRDKTKLEKRANELFSGARYPVKLPWGEPSKEKPIHINDMLKELERVYPKAQDSYSFLCEFAHPNLLLSLNAYLCSIVRARAWENPIFAKDFIEVLDKQVSCLSKAIRGIKTSTYKISNLCAREYGLVFKHR